MKETQNGGDARKDNEGEEKMFDLNQFDKKGSNLGERSRITKEGEKTKSRVLLSYVSTKSGERNEIAGLLAPESAERGQWEQNFRRGEKCSNQEALGKSMGKGNLETRPRPVESISVQGKPVVGRLRQHTLVGEKRKVRKGQIEKIQI